MSQFPQNAYPDLPQNHYLKLTLESHFGPASKHAIQR
jgi:hypothetical protein